jgi:hypothetical protein
LCQRLGSRGGGRNITTFKFALRWHPTRPALFGGAVTRKGGGGFGFFNQIIFAARICPEMILGKLNRRRRQVRQDLIKKSGMHEQIFY